jgi:nitroreductase
MKSVIEVLRCRRSVRVYQPCPLARRYVALLAESVLRSPSSRGIDPWEFIFVNDAGILGLLSHAKKDGSEFLTDAALAVVVCADGRKSDVWIEDCSIAAIILQLAAQSLGLGSCWVQIRNRRHSPRVLSEDYVRKLLGIPRHVRVLSIIGIGHPGEKKKPVPVARLKRRRIRWNRFAER